MSNIIFDKKLDCCSVMETMKISNYLAMVEKAYKSKGGISGQRDALKQKTAITIRNRMIKDITEGAILPPIVIGIIIDDNIYDTITDGINILDVIKNIDEKNISIIDGMQRTTAILNAMEINNSISANTIRVEFWVSKNVNSLLYRMLVLNTGQVPWNMRRQVEIIFGGIINKIKNQVDGISIIEIDDNHRRKKGGEYNANDLVEMFLAFGARTWKVDTKEKLTDEFTRGDFIQSSGEADVVNIFCDMLKIMSNIDIILDNKIEKNPEINLGKFNAGRDLFSSSPAKIGFAAACGTMILGRPGVTRTRELIINEAEKVENSLNKFIVKLSNVTDILDFVDFSTLSELTEKKASKIGDYERELFYTAFKELIESNGEIDSLTVCWRAY